MLSAVGLPTGYRADAWPALRDTMAVDKKARGARLRLDGSLQMPGGLWRPELLHRSVGRRGGDGGGGFLATRGG